ncbi:MAG: NYN domain-containing protein [Rhodocyclaceae bacterium]|nr:NYN domain-containing protein [Rhodocyclaceae bacterium]
MAASDTTSMALFCDFENVALGVRDAKYEKFDIKPVLERLLAKGSIVVKKAYCDWERYKAFKATMHEANFELIEIPHVRQSGKNSADIRMVVDALDLCYTKAHVDTFVIISGDSDFSPLVSKLRENAKQVIGVGIKQSTSDLLIANCDEFIFYDDLVREREAQRASARREQQPKRSPEEEKKRREEGETKKAKAVELAAATFDDLIAVRGDAERIWASVLKEAIKRRNPGFNESYYGYKTFGGLLDDAAARGFFGVGRDEKSGTYVTRAAARPAPVEAVVAAPVEVAPAEEASAPAADAAPARRRDRGRKSGGDRPAAAGNGESAPAAVRETPPPAEAAVQESAEPSPAKAPAKGARRGKAAKPAAAAEATDAAPAMPVTPVAPAAEAGRPAGRARGRAAPSATEAKPAARARRPRGKAKEGAEGA